MFVQKDHDLSQLNGALSRPDTQSLCHSHQFRDIDAFSEALPGQRATLLQFNAEHFKGEIVKVQVGDLQLIRIASNCRVYTSGAKAADGIIFSICLLSPKQSLISHKTALPQDSLFGFDPARDVDLVTPEQIQMAVIIIPIAKLQQYLHDVERDDLDAKFFQQNYIQLTNNAQRELNTYLRQLFYLATTNPQFLQRSQPLITGDLLPLLVNCFSAEVCPRLRIHPFRRADLVQQAEAFISANLDQPLTLEAICKAVKTSKSALSYGFHDIFGISPMAYLKLIRLNGVYRSLKASQPNSAAVSGIANQYGFWHMGHFSNDYKQMFGESPSETLKNSKFGNSRSGYSSQICQSSGQQGQASARDLLL
jgi:AraC family ethanolamine operon transcriptional activator